MNLDIFVVFSSLVGLFLLLGAGYAAVKLNAVPSSASPGFSALLLKITLPCTIITSMLRPFDPSFLTDSVVIIAFSTALFLLNSLIAWPLSKLFHVKEGSRGVWSLIATFCNNGFMGFPVAFALFGDKGLALAAMINIPFNLLLYSLGVRLMCRDIPGRDKKKSSLRKVIITPINIAVLLGLLFYLTQVSIPALILTPLQYLSNITTPLSMFVTGMALAAVKIREVLDWDTISLTVVRLLFMPGLAWVMIQFIPFSNPLIPSVALIILAMPAPGISASLAETYGGNRDLAAKATFLTSLLCILTIPLFAMLL